MELLAALPGVITSCLLAYVLKLVLDRLGDERRAHTEQVAQLTVAQSAQIAELLEAHRKEVQTLCQRIQAPEQAVMTHLAENAPPDPPQLDLENDLALMEQRERELEGLGLSTEGLM